MANLSNINNILRTSSLGVGINCDAEFSLDIEKASANAILSLNSNGGSGAEYLLSSTTSGEFVLNKRYVGDRLTISSGGDATFAGNVLLNGYLSVEGTTGNTGGATDRWIGGDGTAGTWFYNVPTGSSHLFGINNSNVLTLNGTGATFAGSVSIDANSGILTQEILKVKGGGSGGAYGFLVEANNGDDLFKVDTSTYNCYFPSSFTKVGINASDPVKTLDVRGQLAISNSASSYWYMDRNDATGNFEILTDTNSSVFNIDTSGKVIINDNTIGDKLLLAGDNAGTARGLMFNCSTTTNQGDTWDIDAQSSTGIIKFSTTSTERMRIDSSGYTKFTKSTGGVVASFYDGTYGVDLAATTTGGSIQTFNTNQTLNLNTYGTGDITFTTSGTSERMRITSAGGISFGSTGTAYGTSGQVLTSNGNAAPTWQAAGGGTVTWPNVGAGTRTTLDLIFKPPTSSYAGFQFLTAAGAGAGYFLIRGTSDAGQIYKAEGITLVSDSSWVTIASRTTSNAGVRLMSGATSAERLVIQDNGHSHFVGNLGIGTNSTSFSSDYDNLIVGTGVGNNGIGIYSGTTGNSTLAFIPDTGGVSDFQIRVEHDYPFGNMEVYFEHISDSYLRMFERSSGQDPIIKVGNNSIPLGLNTGDDAIMQFRPENSNWFPAIAINAEDSGGNSRGFIEMKSNRSSTSSADYFLKFFNYNSNEIGSIRVNNNNNNVAYNTSSDYRMKEDLKEFKALDTVSKIKVYNYKWKNDSSGFRDQGILAHELDELIPQAVSGEKDATDKDNNILPQSVDYSKIVPHLVQSIQELKAEIEILKNK